MPIVDLTSHTCQQEGNFVNFPVCAGARAMCAHTCGGQRTTFRVAPQGPSTLPTFFFFCNKLSH